MTKDNKNKIASGYSLDFEYTLALLFGDEAYQTASFAKNDKFRTKWLRRAVKRMLKDVNSLDTTQRHKEMLVLNLQRIDRHLIKGNNIWEIVYSLFNLSIRFLGYDYHKAQRLITPTYFQTKQQDFWANRYVGEDWQKYEEKRANFIAKRMSIILLLKKEGYSDFEVSQIFNTTEYDIKKSLRELRKSNVKNK